MALVGGVPELILRDLTVRRAPRFDGFKPSSPIASSVGRANRKRGTAPERLLRRALREEGARFTTNAAQITGKPDIVFRPVRVAVFCDGDFWHGRDWIHRKRKLARGSNARYWIAKIAANRARDKRVSAILAAAGWLAIRVWESDVKGDPTAVARRLLRAVERRRKLNS
jgi:DNA mismatch endonuclease (patch repair protein)